MDSNNRYVGVERGSKGSELFIGGCRCSLPDDDEREAEAEDVGQGEVDVT